MLQYYFWHNICFSIPRFNLLLYPLAPLSIETIEFTTLVLSKVQNFIKTGAFAFLVENCGLKDNRYQYWQLPILAGITNPKIYCHHWIHYAPFVQSTKFNQNWKIYHFWSKTVTKKITGANIDRSQYWHMSRITKNFATIKFRAFNVSRVSNFIKTEALATLA